MFLIAFCAYTTRVRSLFGSQLQGLKPVDQDTGRETRRRQNRKLFIAGSPTNGVNAFFFDGVAIGMGRVFSRAVAIVSIAVRARIFCAESLFDLGVVLGAINFFAGCALLGLRVTLCVGSSRLGMLDYKT